MEVSLLQGACAACALVNRFFLAGVYLPCAETLRRESDFLQAVGEHVNSGIAGLPTARVPTVVKTGFIDTQTPYIILGEIGSPMKSTDAFRFREACQVGAQPPRMAVFPASNPDVLL